MDRTSFENQVDRQAKLAVRDQVMRGGVDIPDRTLHAMLNAETMRIKAACFATTLAQLEAPEYPC